MKHYKRIGLLAVFFLLLGVGFTNGLKYKYTDVNEEVVEIVRVNKIKKIKRVPASDEEVMPIVPAKVAITNNTPSPSSLESYRNDTSYPTIEPADSDSFNSYAEGGGYIPMSDNSNTRFGSSYSGSPSTSNRAGTGNGTSPTSSSNVGYGSGGYAAAPYVGSNSDSTPTTTTNNSQNKPDPTDVSFSISSIAIKEGQLILKGKNLSAVKTIQVNGNSVSGNLIKVSDSTSELIAMGINGIKLVAGKVYNLVVSDAYASSTFPIEIVLADGSISPRKLAPLSASEDGFVLKWDAIGRTWVAAPDEVGSGPDGGISSITKGAGIVGEGAVIEAVGSIAVDVGTNAHQIPQFNVDKKLILNNSNVIELNETSTISFKEETEEFVFGMFSEIFKLRNKTTDATIFEVDGNDFKVSGRSVCLSDGTNCPTTGGDYVSLVTAAPPLSASGTDSVTISLGMDNTSIGLNGGNQLTVLAGGITSSKLDSMGANTVGQVLKWSGSNWEAGTDLNNGLTTESDPTVAPFAKSANFPAVCDPNEKLTILGPLDTFTCEPIVLESTDMTAVIENAINDNENTKAPTQNAVFDALAGKQNSIDASSDITMKYLKLMTDGAFWVGFKAPALTTGNLLFTLPNKYGDPGQVLKTDGSGNLDWVDATTGSVTGITATAPLAASGTGTVTISLGNDGITNSHINSAAAISWSKIDTSGATAADVGAASSTTTFTAGTALSGGGDLSSNRTLNVSFDDSTVGVNGSNQLIVKNGGITNDHISASAAIAWSKIDTTGATADTDTTGILSSTDWNLFYNKLDSTLDSGKIFVGNSSHEASAVTMTGDATLSNTGVLTLATIPLTKGGTGATTQAGAANAVLPSQGGNGGKFLTTDGSNVSWSPIVFTETDTLASVTGRGATTSTAVTLNGGASFPGNGIWNSSGNVGIGTTNPALALHISRTDVNADILLESTSATVGGQSGLVMINYNKIGSSDSVNKVEALGARGTNAAPSLSLIDDKLLQIMGRGYTGTDGFLGFNTAAGINILSDGNMESGSAPGRLEICTTSTGSNFCLPRIVVKNSGNVGIGTTSPQTSLDLSGKTDAVRLPAGTTAERPAAPANGDIRYNAQTAKLEAYVGGQWITVAGGGSSGLRDCNTGNPNDVMVPVGNWCVDKYEASVWSSADGSGTSYFRDGLSGDTYYPNAANLPPDFNRDGSGASVVYAVSKPGVIPARGLTWFQASVACANSGKQLIPDSVWVAAALGTKDPGAGSGTGGLNGGSATDAAAAQCNINTSAASTGTWIENNNNVRPTAKAGATSQGTNACISRFGVEDMVGNLWEWTDAGSVPTGVDSAGFAQGKNNTNGGPFSTADGTWNVNGSAHGCDGPGSSKGTCGWKNNTVSAALRGGTWNSGAHAGVFALLLSYSASNSRWNLGFRCARSR